MVVPRARIKKKIEKGLEKVALEILNVAGKEQEELEFPLIKREE